MTTLKSKRQEARDTYLLIRKLRLDEGLSFDAIAERLSLRPERVHYLYKRHRRADLIMKSFEKLKNEQATPKIPKEYLKYLP